METETSITDRFLNELERTINQYGRNGDIVFRARALRDRGLAASEKRFGADFCGVLDVRLRDFEYSKGFLSQAKTTGRGLSVEWGLQGRTTVTFSEDDNFHRLKEQVDRMLSVTPDSFVIVYSTDGFVVVPASSVKGLSASDSIYAKPVNRFFKEYLMCFIGDPRLRAFDHRTLESLNRETNARAAIMFQILKIGEYPQTLNSSGT